MNPLSRTLVVLNLMFFGAGLALFVQGQRASASAQDLQVRLERMEGRLDQLLAQRQAPAVALKDPAPQQPTVPDAQNTVAWSRGNEVVDRALSARRWGDDQARELSASMSSLTQQQQMALLRRLSVAINEGQLTVETHGPPF